MSHGEIFKRMGNAFYDGTSESGVPRESEMTPFKVEIGARMISHTPIDTSCDHKALEGPLVFLCSLQLSYILTRPTVSVRDVYELSHKRCLRRQCILYLFMYFESAVVGKVYRHTNGEQLFGSYIVVKVDRNLTKVHQEIYNITSRRRIWRSDGTIKQSGTSDVPDYALYTYKDHTYGEHLLDTLNKLVIFHNPDNTSLLVFYHNIPVKIRRLVSNSSNNQNP